MLDLFHDLLGHERWADEVMLAALAEVAGAWEDNVLRVKAHHIHAVQLFYSRLLAGKDLEFDSLDDEPPSLDAHRASVATYHEQMAAWASTLAEEALEGEVLIPVEEVGNPRNRLHESLTQIVMHNQYHRGQLAMRLRELGHTPPTTDYIVWVWRGRPAGPAVDAK